MKILVLTIQEQKYTFVNDYIIPDAFHRMGHDVFLGDVDTLSISDNQIYAKQKRYTEAKVGDDYVVMDELKSCEDYDLIWLLEYAHPNNLQEFFQILWVLEKRVKFVNSPSSMFFINNKIGVLGLEAAKYFPTTNLFSEAQDIKNLLDKNPEKSWVIKPPNSGCGADVFVLDKNDPNCSALLQSATGNAYQKYEMFKKEAYGKAERYAIMQEFLPELKGEESRVLIAADKVVGGMKKIAAGNEFRGNIILGGHPEALTISDAEESLCVEIGKELMKYGIHYAGIDMSFPHVIEYNLVNPGGINAHYRATGDDISIEVCETILSTLFPK